MLRSVARLTLLKINYNGNVFLNIFKGEIILSEKKLNKQSIQEVLNEAYGPNTYRVLKTYRTETRDQKVEVQCIKCNSINEYSYQHFKKGNTKCACKDPEGLKRMAKNYAGELYIEPYEGLIIGEELGNFILECLGHDMPMMRDCTEFVDMVEDYLLTIYEEKEATVCKRCGKWYPGRNIDSKGICIACRKGV